MTTDELRSALVSKATRKGFRAACNEGVVFIALDRRRVSFNEVRDALPELEDMPLQRAHDGYVSLSL